MEYELIKAFECCGRNMVIVGFENAAHVMPIEEWKSVYGKLHPERWKDGKRVRKSKESA